MLNKELIWEIIMQYNFGLDFGFFNNCILGSIDIYKVEIWDILMNCVILFINGYVLVMENIGKIESIGVDLILSMVNI